VNKRPRVALTQFDDGHDGPSEFTRAGVVSSTLMGNLSDAPRLKGSDLEQAEMDGIVYLVGLIVIIMFILSLFGLR
jgi:hypothetical protein